MKTKLMIAIAAFGLSIASAKTYHITLYQASTVGGTELKPGQYSLDVENGKATIRNGKLRGEAAVKVENVERKFDNTTVRYSAQGGKVQEIRVGGTNLKVVFND